MAVTIPETLGPGVGTSGEQKVLAALRGHLPDSYVVYYHGETQGRRPAFVIIGPELGVVALESRDWPLDAIARVTSMPRQTSSSPEAPRESASRRL